MFNFSWSEIALIAVVALIAIGPKDLPAALKTVAQVIKKARGMAAEFQTHVNDLMREADLEDVRKHIDEIRNFDFKGTIEQTIDPDQSIRKTFTEDPFAAASTPVEPAGPHEAAPEGDLAVLERPGTDEATETAAEKLSAAGRAVGLEAEPEAPAFVPPSVAAARMHPPAFVPPDLLSQRS